MRDDTSKYRTQTNEVLCSPSVHVFQLICFFKESKPTPVPTNTCRCGQIYWSDLEVEVSKTIDYKG
jgi:hypothetical protein